MKKATIAGLIAALALTGVPFAAPAPSTSSGQQAAGKLDPTFGAGGKALTDFGQSDAIEGLVVQRDGKIVAAGTTQNQTTFDTSFALARYARNGSLDASFGTGGKVTTDFGGRENRAYAVALQGDGKIVAAGLSSGGPTGTDMALARYNADGSLDASFGAGGKVLTDFDSTHDSAFMLAIQTDGRLVVLGSTRQFGSFTTNPSDFALARYHPNGSLDTSFDGDGKVSTGFTPGWDDRGLGLALAPDGKMVAAGFAFNYQSGFGPSVIDVARYNADGSLDGSFDGDGKVVTASSRGNMHAQGVVVQADGRVVVAGSAEDGFALLRYTVGGSLDSTFGEGGIASAGFGTNTSSAQALARLPDGKLVAAGTVGPASSAEEFAFAVARFERSGTLDRSFSGGAISSDFGQRRWDEARALAVQRDGKTVAGGLTAEVQNGDPVNGDFALARYMASPPLCRVPNVRGNTLAAAKTRIRAANCAVGRVRRVRSRKKIGRVVAQSPAAGRTLPNLGKVNLLISSGRKS